MIKMSDYWGSDEQTITFDQQESYGVNMCVTCDSALSLSAAVNGRTLR